MFAAIWLTTVVGLMSVLVQYSASPGPAGVIPNRRPAGSRIPFDSSRHNLILFAHPRCPCTRATLGELETLMAQHHGRLATQVWFIEPAGVAADWTDTALWRKASSIPGVTVHRDDEMTEARRFGAGTSGHALLYDEDGNLQFHGGITLLRGHSGDNPGRRAVEILLQQKPGRLIQTPVFGCPLFSTTSEEGAAVCRP